MDGEDGLLRRIGKDWDWFQNQAEKPTEADISKLNEATDGMEIADSISSDVQLAEIIITTIYDLLAAYGLELDHDDIWPEFSDDLIYGPRNLLDSVVGRVEAMRLNLQPRQNVSESPTSKVDPTDNVWYNTPLDPENGYIRVLHILPGKDGDPIYCSLEVRSLSQDGIEEALSYVWGKEGGPWGIWLDEHWFSTTRNLYLALNGLRYVDKVRTIWVDAICINQADIIEKGTQVKFMRNIYAAAKSVIIWLKTEDDEEAIESTNLDSSQPDFSTMLASYQENITRVNDVINNQGDPTSLISAVSALAESCHDILSQAWWTRVWTVQEALLAASPPMIYFRGGKILWSDLTTAVLLFRRDWKNLTRWLMTEKVDINPPDAISPVRSSDERVEEGNQAIMVGIS
jgi:hypothetical protein